MPSPPLPLSTVQFAASNAKQTSFCDIRPFIAQIPRNPQTAPLLDTLIAIQQAFDNLQQSLRTLAPSLQSLQIDSSDLTSLKVGGTYGPPALQITDPAGDDLGSVGPSGTVGEVLVKDTAAHSAELLGSGALKVNGTQVVGAQLASIAPPSGGATIDSQARTAINDIRARLAAHGLIAP